MAKAEDGRRGRGKDDVLMEGQAGHQTRDRHQTRTRTRGADHVADARRTRGRGSDDPASAQDDKGGRIDRDKRFEPGDDRRINGRPRTP
jgi:hypothetical protein